MRKLKGKRGRHGCAANGPIVIIVLKVLDCGLLQGDQRPLGEVQPLRSSGYRLFLATV
jgi:hypothetical protein